MGTGDAQCIVNECEGTDYSGNRHPPGLPLVLGHSSWVCSLRRLGPSCKAVASLDAVTSLLSRSGSLASAPEECTSPSLPPSACSATGHSREPTSRFCRTSCRRSTEAAGTQGQMAYFPRTVHTSRFLGPAQAKLWLGNVRLRTRSPL